MRDDGDEVVLAISLPFAERAEIDVVRHHDELIVTVGSYRRALVLPDSLKRRKVLGARLEEGVLDVRFGMRDE
jgi:arsenite-transporting ATPase